LSLYEQLGISFDREAEVYEAGFENGMHVYGGWHHFIGRVIHDPGTMISLADHFSICFLEGGACAEPAFGDHSLVRADFSARLLWVLPEKPTPSI
jgi:hypothetical protein